jgi:hypothetical protein
MMADLKFNVKLAEKVVLLTGEDGTERKFKLKELSGDQREDWNKKFDYSIEIIDGKTTAKPGKDFKMPSPKEFLSLCFYDPEDKLVKPEVIGAYGQTMLDTLHLEGLKLSGMDPASLKKAKNEFEANEDNGTESPLT